MCNLVVLDRVQHTYVLDPAYEYVQLQVLVEVLQQFVHLHLLHHVPVCLLRNMRLRLILSLDHVFRCLLFAH